MPSCDVVPDSTDLGTDRPNLRPITEKERVLVIVVDARR